MSLHPDETKLILFNYYDQPAITDPNIYIYNKWNTFSENTSGKNWKN